MFEQTIRDLHHALRSMARAPILAAVVIGSLAIGIGVNTVVFSWIQAMVFRPIPGVEDASSIYLIEPRTETGLRPGASWLEYRDLQERLRSLPDLVAFRMVPFNIGETSRTERVSGLLVSGNYFSALGLRPAAGRLLRPDEASRAGSEPVVVISHDFWQTRYAGRADAVGQVLRVNGRDMTIIGVTPEAFQGTVLGLQFDLWLPATMAPLLLGGSRELDDRGVRGYYVMAPLQPPATVAQAQAETTDAMRQLAQLYPETNATMQANVEQFWRASRGPQGFLLQALSILQLVMFLLLLAVCGNTANLVLARASSRQREIGVRLAVGAGSWRIVRLLLAENLAMGLAAAGLGAVIAVWGTNALRAVPLLTTSFPVRFQTSIDGMSLLFAMALGVVCALAFGVAPALQLARVDPQTVLRSGAGLSSRGRLRNALMGIQVALALVVLIVAGLFLQSFRETQESNPGFTPEGVLLAAYDLTGRDVDNAGARVFAARLLEQLRALPDVEAASIATQVPLDIHGLPLRAFVLEGRARADGTADRALSNTVTPGYFATMRIPILAGTDFADLNDTATPPQAIVNDAFVTHYLGTAEPLGRRMEIRGTTYVITGIVRHSLYESFSEPPTPIIYLSYRDRPSIAGEIHLRTRLGDETMLAPGVRDAARAIDAALPVYNVRTLAQHVDTNLALRKIPARMFVVLGPLLLVLASIGIYAVVAYSVAHRTSEIGVRLALGATTSRVISQIVRETLRIVIVGAVVGWLMVFGVFIHLSPGTPLDATAFFGVPVLLLLVAAFASWLPARRAASVAPMVALRQD
jgi:predicted permease